MCVFCLSCAVARTRPASVMGMHFFSPAHIMPLVECVRGKDSSATTIAAVMGVSKRLKKVQQLSVVFVVLLSCPHGSVNPALSRGRALRMAWAFPHRRGIGRDVSCGEYSLTHDGCRDWSIV